MDKVQIYYTIGQAIYYIAALVMLGAVSNDDGKFVKVVVQVVLTTLLSLPIMGRIYGWW